MEVEELNKLMELKSFDEGSYNRALAELKKAGKAVTPEAVFELFEKYNLEAGAIFGSKELDEMAKQRQ